MHDNIDFFMHTKIKFVVPQVSVFDPLIVLYICYFWVIVFVNMLLSSTGDTQLCQMIDCHLSVKLLNSLTDTLINV